MNPAAGAYHTLQAKTGCSDCVTYTGMQGLSVHAGTKRSTMPVKRDRKGERENDASLVD